MSNPSLILPQSPAYGEDYVYAAQVEDGAVPLYNVLPLTFTRASGGTRINKDGLVQNMPYNLLQQSETFDNGVWVKSSVSITANYDIAPNGTNTADRWVSSGGAFPQIYQNINLTSGSVYTASLYVKSDGTTQIQQTILIGGSIVNFTPTTSWQRITVNFTASASDSFVIVTYSGSASASSFLIWGAQVNIGSTAQPYLATTDRLNMPRITYPVGGGCGALLLEKQSTNLILHSEQFDNVDWTKAQGNGGSLPIITANYGISPNGTQNADRIQLTRTTQTSSFSYVYQTYIGTPGNAYTWSIWLKSLSGTPTVALSYDGSSYVNIVTLTTEWQRYTFTSNAISTSLQATFLLFQNLSGTSLSADFLAWGAQLEASSYATSYIPTTSTSATRIADACYKTGISNLIGQTQGTLFVDVDFKYNNETTDKDTRIWSTWDDSYIKVISIWARDNALRYQVYDAATSLNIENSITASQGRHKVALAYNGTSLIVYMDGSLVINTSMSQNAPATSRAGFAYFWNLNMIHHSIGINNAQLYNIALSTSELATLTS